MLHVPVNSNYILWLTLMWPKMRPEKYLPTYLSTRRTELWNVWLETVVCCKQSSWWACCGLTLWHRNFWIYREFENIIHPQLPPMHGRIHEWSSWGFHDQQRRDRSRIEALHLKSWRGHAGELWVPSLMPTTSLSYLDSRQEFDHDLQMEAP